MELNHDFQEFLQSFVTRDVRFLIVGGQRVRTPLRVAVTAVIAAGVLAGCFPTTSATGSGAGHQVARGTWHPGDSRITLEGSGAHRRLVAKGVTFPLEASDGVQLTGHNSAVVSRSDDVTVVALISINISDHATDHAGLLDEYQRQLALLAATPGAEVVYEDQGYTKPAGTDSLTGSTLGPLENPPQGSTDRIRSRVFVFALTDGRTVTVVTRNPSDPVVDERALEFVRAIRVR